MKMFLHSSVLSLLGFSLAVLPVCTASAIPENFSYSSAVKQNYEYSRYAALDDYLVVTMTEPGTLKDQITDEMVDGVTRLRIVGNIRYDDFYRIFKCKNLVALDLSQAIMTDDGNGVPNVIHGNALDGLASLQELYLPQTVTSIGSYAFRGTGLLKIEIPEGVTELGAGAFQNCAYLTEAVLPESLTVVGRLAFASCGSLSSVKLSSKTTLIKESAFQYCSSLTEVELPETLEEIEYGAFKETSISKVVLGPNVKKLASLVWGTTPLNDITCYAVTPPELPFDGFDTETYETAILRIPEGTMDAYLDGAGWGQFVDIEYISDDDPGGTVDDYLVVTMTEPGTLKDQITDEMVDGVTRLRIVGNIRYDDFYRIFKCKNLVALDLSQAIMTDDGNGVPNVIHGNALDGLASLQELYLPQTVTSIGSYAFRGTGLLKIEIPEGVTELGAGAFQNCAYLTEAVLPESLTVVGRLAFASCGSLSSVKLSSKTTLIKESAFQYCSSLTEVELPETLEEIEYGAFKETSISKVVLGPNVKKLASLVWGTTPLNDITCYAVTPPELPFDGFDTETYETAILRIPEGTMDAYLDGAGWGQFVDIEYISNDDPGHQDETVAINVEKAGTLKDLLTQSDAAAVKELKITGQIDYTDIEYIRNCTALESLDLGGAQITDDGAGRENATPEKAFSGYASLTKVELPQGLVALGAESFKGALIASVTIPASVTEIGSAAFMDCKNLASFLLPSGVTSVPASVFENCGSLSSAVLHLGVKNIGDKAFKNCTSITAFGLPTGIETIGEEAFAGTKIAEVGFGEVVKSVGSKAYAGVPVTKVTSLNPVPPVVSEDTFDASVYENATLVISDFFEEAYKADAVWALFKNVELKHGTVVDPDGFTRIYNAEGGSLSEVLTGEIKTSCTKLRILGNLSREDFVEIKNLQKLQELDITEATIVASLKDAEKYPANEFPKMAFQSATNIKRVYLPASIESIGDSAFEESGLTEILIPGSVKSVGVYLFAHCASLKKVTIEDGLEATNTYMFLGCSALTEVNLPSTLKTLGSSTFTTCTALKSVSLPVGLETIGTDAFARSGIENITLPESVTYIGKEAFVESTLSLIVCEPNVAPEVDLSAFDDRIFAEAMLKFHKASVDSYLDNVVWSQFVNYQYIEGGVSDAEIVVAPVSVCNGSSIVMNADADRVAVYSTQGTLVAEYGNVVAGTELAIEHSGIYMIVVDGKVCKVIIR